MAYERAPAIASKLIQEQLRQPIPNSQFDAQAELSQRIYSELSADPYIVEMARPFGLLGHPVALLPFDRDPLPAPAKVFLFIPEAPHDKGGTFKWLDWGSTRHHVDKAMRESADTQFIAAIYEPHDAGYFVYSPVDHVDIQTGLIEGEKAERFRLANAVRANRPRIQSMDATITVQAMALVEKAGFGGNVPLVGGR